MALDVGFVLYYFGFPIFIVAIWNRCIGGFNRIGLPQFVLVFLFFSGYVGLLALYFEWDAYRAQIGFTDPFILITILGYSSLCIIFVVLGAILARACVGICPHISAGVNVHPVSIGALIPLVLLVCVSCLALVLYLSRLKSVALFVALSDGPEAAHIARSAMTNAFEGGYHWYSLFMHEVAAWVCFMLFVVKLKQPSFLVNCAFFFSFFLVLFAKIMTTEKAPLAWFLLGLFLVYVLVKKNGFISMKTVMASGGAVLVVVLAAHVLILDVELIKAAKLVFSRTFTGSITPAYWYLEYFPSEQSWLLGSSFPNPAGVFPFEPYSLTQEIMAWKFPPHLNGGIVGSAPTIFWGELYANFAWLGVVFGSYVVGFIIYLVGYFVNQIKALHLRIGLLVWCCMHYKQLAVTGISGFIIDLNAFTIFLLTLLLALTSDRLKIE